jgi:hypothetical protein
MSNRISRLAPLIGLLALPFGLIAFASSQSGPGVKSGGGPVIAFYVAHRTGQITSDMAWMLAFSSFLLFAGALRGHLRRDPRGETLSALLLAGATVLTTGAAVYFGCDYVLARAAVSLSAPAAQALNQLGLSMFLPVISGAIVFGVTSGIAILRTGLLPKALGAAAILIAIAAPVAGFGVILAIVLWTAAASVLLFRRSARDAQPARIEPTVAARTANVTPNL